MEDNNKDSEPSPAKQPSKANVKIEAAEGADRVEASSGSSSSSKTQTPAVKDGASSSETKVKTEAKSSTSSASATAAAASMLAAASGTGEDSDMDEAGARRALQEYMAMAQSVQSAQQMALASGLISAYGSQAVAYLQAAAVTGKPLASMLSMAMLTQAQQQQQQQQQQQLQQAAAMSLLPKRGRGSRGGATARSGRGSVGLKLKRLDS